MFRFFRLIRQKLFAGKKFSKYAIYAIGEIFLVVIGILIALQINNWNEERKKTEKEIQIVNGIYKELDKNIAYVKRLDERYERKQNSINKVSESLLSQSVKVDGRTFDSLLVDIVLLSGFDLKNDKLNKTLSSQDFEFKRAEDLINSMIHINEIYSVLEDSYSYNVDLWKNITQPFLIDHYSIRFFYVNDENHLYKESNAYMALLKDPKFDNILQSIKTEMESFVSWLKYSITEMEKLIIQMEAFYPDIKNFND